MRLMREVRFFAVGDAAENGGSNSWAGSLGSEQLALFWRLQATVQGDVDPRTGYVCSLTDIEDILRTHVMPRLIDDATGAPLSITALATRFAGAWTTVATTPPLGDSICSMELWVSPCLRLGALIGDVNMVRLTQSFEFSASHRLYVAHLSDEENDRLFGKCANINGHGHNYVLDVTIRRATDLDDSTALSVPAFERLVKKRVIDRFDHKNLNLDCAEFQDTNPTVENIASVIWRLLSEDLGDTLIGVRVWETPKTYAECGYDQ